MDELAWTEGLSIGIDQVDQEHRDLIAIYNELRSAILAGAPAGSLYGLLFKLTTHAEAHFKSEEIHMMAEAYPGLKAHRERHIDLLRQVGVLTLQVGADAGDLPARVLEILNVWLLEHILTEDKAFGDWTRR